MPAYYIGEHKIADFAKFDEYLQKTIPMIERFGGKYLTKSGTHEVIEGNWKPNRVVISNFQMLPRSSDGMPRLTTSLSSFCGKRPGPT